MAWSRQPARRFAVVVAATVALVPLLGLWSVISVARAARPHEALSLEELGAHDVAIVPGSSISHGKPNMHLARRLDGARQLYERGLVRRVLVSGNEKDGEVSAMTGWLVEHGVRASDILRDPNGVRTLETMRNAARKFAIGSAVVCTQSLYLDRAVFLAREAGMDAVGVGAKEGHLRPSAPVVEAAKTALAFFEVRVLKRFGQVEPQPTAPVAVVAQVR